MSTGPRLLPTLFGGHSEFTLRRPWPRGTSGEGTPDRSKLFGSHGQRPWIHEVNETCWPPGGRPIDQAHTVLGLGARTRSQGSTSVKSKNRSPSVPKNWF